MFNCVTTATAAGIQRRMLTDNKASSGTGLPMVADAFGFPDKEEVRGSNPRRPTQVTDPLGGR